MHQNIEVIWADLCICLDLFYAKLANLGDGPKTRPMKTFAILDSLNYLALNQSAK